MINHFDIVAGDWDKNQVHLQRTDAIAKELLRIIPVKKKLKALEFGAGTGLLSFALKDCFSEITLMDSSSEMINTTIKKIAGNKIDNLYPLFFDLEKNEYTEKKFDFIFTQMALHHVINPEGIILKFNRLLNTGGHIAIADLYKEDGSFHDFSFNGHYGFDPDNLSGILRKSGFINLKHKQVFVIKKVDIENLEKEFPVFLIVAEKGIQ
jgi:tRNA (cmo5U34)-methyltransferase